MSIHHELRERYPDWAKITPAKRLILQHLVDNGGEVQFWPGNVMRSMGPKRRLELVGYIETWQRAEDRYAKTRITDDGRAALRSVETVQINGKSYRRFIPYRGPVNDGTVRCMGCGQIDETPWHDADLCAEVHAASVARQARITTPYSSVGGSGNSELAKQVSPATELNTHPLHQDSRRG